MKGEPQGQDGRYADLIREIGMSEPTPEQAEELDHLIGRMGLETLVVDANVVRLMEPSRLNGMLVLKDPEFCEGEEDMPYEEVLKRAEERGVSASLYLAQTNRMIIFDTPQQVAEAVKSHGDRIGTLSLKDDITSDELADIPDLRGLKKLTLPAGLKVSKLPPKKPQEGDDPKWARWEALFSQYRDNTNTEALATLARFTEVTHLNMSQCAAVSTRQLGFLESMPELEDLNCSGMGIGNGMFDALKGLKKLRRIDLSQNEYITGHGAEQLSECHTLSDVNLNTTGVNDDGLLQIATLPGLTHLDVSYYSHTSDDSSQITDRGLQYLQIAENLKKVKLNFTQTTEQAVSDLKFHFKGKLKVDWYQLGGLGD